MKKMKKKMATRTSALGQVGAERHRANELRAYYSFGESLIEAHRVVRKKKCCPFASVPRRKKRGRLLTCDVEYR